MNTQYNRPMFSQMSHSMTQPPKLAHSITQLQVLFGEDKGEFDEVLSLLVDDAALKAATDMSESEAIPAIDPLVSNDTRTPRQKRRERLGIAAFFLVSIGIGGLLANNYNRGQQDIQSDLNQYKKDCSAQVVAAEPDKARACYAQGMNDFDDRSNYGDDAEAHALSILLPGNLPEQETVERLLQAMRDYDYSTFDRAQRTAEKYLLEHQFEDAALRAQLTAAVYGANG